MTMPSSDMVRNVAVAVLAAVIIALGSAIVVHGRDLVELRTRITEMEKKIDLILTRIDNTTIHK